MVNVRRNDRRRAALTGLTGATLAVGLTLVGCGPDPRISVQKFLELQQNAAQASDSADQTPSAPPDPAMIERILGPYLVGVGDTLTVSFAGPDLPFISPVVCRIDRNGDVHLPLVGGVKVLDKAMEDVELAISSAYVPRILKDVAIHVELTNFESTKVMVVGAVQVPGFTRLRHTERNVLVGVVMAGGVTADATGRATLRRLKDPSQEVTFDLTKPEDARAAMALPPLDNGDIIVVEAAPRAVFVGGLVNAPGPIVLEPGTELNLLQALAAAGGLRTDLTPREGTLIHRMADGSDAQVKIDLDKLGASQETNLQLAAGDILWVPHTVETRVQEFINHNIFLRAGASVNYNVSGIEFMNRRHLQSARGGGGGLQDSFDPYGFLLRNQVLQGLSNQP